MRNTKQAKIAYKAVDYQYNFKAQLPAVMVHNSFFVVVRILPHHTNNSVFKWIWPKTFSSWGAGVEKNRIKTELMAYCQADGPWVFKNILYLLYSYLSVSKSPRISCFHLLVVRFLHVVHTVYKYAACRAGLEGRSFFILCRFVSLPWQPTCAIPAPCEAGVK